MALTLHRIVPWPCAPLLALAVGAQAQCPAPVPSELVERFIAADCETCWRAGSAPADSPFVLDWIVPSARGDEAPLATAALAEATARAGRMPLAGLLQRRQAMPASRDVRVDVQDGPAWSGYIGLQLRVQREGAALQAPGIGYLALVENVPAGTEGTPIDRQLVRALSGPLPLDGARASIVHLLALRIPNGAKAERLVAVGWVESPPGKVIALARAAPADCTAAR